MRTHPSTYLSFPDYEAIHPNNRRAMFDHENHEKNQRHQQMERNDCAPFGERGIKLANLPAGSRVPEIIQQQSWEGFIETRPMYCTTTVKEFFACMIPAVYHDRCVVRMGDREVRISPADIDAYFRAPHRPELAATYGLFPNEAFRVQLSPVIAASLRRNGHRGWDKTTQHILKSEMHYDIAFLMLFVKASLKPSTHNTTADSQVAEVLYSLHNNLSMDIGRIIWMEILDAGMTLDGILPFPCLITHFCREAGVPIGRLTAPMKDFSKTQYQHQITAANKLEERRRADPNFQIRRLAERIHVSSESASDSDSDYDPQAPAAPAAAAYVHDDETPHYMRRFMDHMNTTVGGINTNVNLGFENLNLRMDSHGNRLNDIDARLAHAGFPSQAPPEAPQDRRRVRGRRGDASSSSRR